MRKLTLLLVGLLLALSQGLSAQVSINPLGIQAHNSAMLDVSSTEKGLLIPRMTTAQRDVIGFPANGLLIYNYETNTFQYWNDTDWVDIGSGGGSGSLTCLEDGDNDTRVCVDTAGTDPDIIYFEIGGTPRWVMKNQTLEALTNGLFIGRGAGIADANASTLSNVAIGDSSMAYHTSGDYNTMVGSNTMILSETGSENTGVGAGALYFNDGNRNTALGSASLTYNSTGSDNIAIGKDAAGDNRTGNRNVAIGNSAMYQNDTLSDQIAIGHGALYAIGTGGDETYYGQQNTAIGTQSMANTTGGAFNTALGYHTLKTNTTGISNVAIGHIALANNNNGFSNTAIGYAAMFGNVSGSHNTAIGEGALQGVGGHNNVALGDDAALNLQGSNNVILGQAAGSQATTTGSVLIGNHAGADENTNNKLYIENSPTADPLIYGEFDNDKVKINGSLEVSTTTGGFITPRLTAAQAAGITAENGLIIYLTDTDATFPQRGFWGYEEGFWVKL